MALAPQTRLPPEGELVQIMVPKSSDRMDKNQLSSASLCARILITTEAGETEIIDKRRKPTIQ